eukprot:2314876-Prymnesium_polylepis.1
MGSVCFGHRAVLGPPPEPPRVFDAKQARGKQGGKQATVACFPLVPKPTESPAGFDHIHKGGAGNHAAGVCGACAPGVHRGSTTSPTATWPCVSTAARRCCRDARDCYVPVMWLTPSE